MAQSRIIDRDLGYEALKRRFTDVGRTSVKVGVLGGKQREGESGLTVAQVAAANEYGTARIPSRPAFRRALDANRPGIRTRIDAEAGAVLDGTRTVDQAFGRLGLYLQGLIRREIVALRDPPNAPSTIERKGSSNPLVDTGQYRQSITFQVVRGAAASAAALGASGRVGAVGGSPL